MYITSKETLAALYQAPSDKAAASEINALDQSAINFIQASPFVVLSTIDTHEDMDISPRGGIPGFVQVLNNNQLIIPDAKGNTNSNKFVLNSELQ